MRRKAKEPEEGRRIPTIEESLMAIGQDRDRLDKMMEMFLDEGNIEHFSDMGRAQRLAFSVLSTMAAKYDLQMLKEFLRHDLALRVSEGRKGRKEWVHILRSEQALEAREAEISRRSRFLGRGR